MTEISQYVAVFQEVEEKQKGIWNYESIGNTAEIFSTYIKCKDKRRLRRIGAKLRVDSWEDFGLATIILYADFVNMDEKRIPTALQASKAGVGLLVESST